MADALWAHWAPPERPEAAGFVPGAEHHFVTHAPVVLGVKKMRKRGAPHSSAVALAERFVPLCLPKIADVEIAADTPMMAMIDSWAEHWRAFQRRHHENLPEVILLAEVSEYTVH